MKRFLAAIILMLLVPGALCHARRPDLYGLPVHSAWQDEFGMMWIGTQDGLIRYDGVNIDTFRPEEGNPGSIYNNNIKMVCGDGQGHVYVICKFALCRYDMAAESFLTIRKTDMQWVCCAPGRVWAATRKEIFRLEGDNLVPAYDFSDIDAEIREILEASDGTLYVGTSAGLWSVDTQGKRSETVPGSDVLGLYEDSHRNICVCTRLEGLLICSPSGTRTAFRHDGTGAGLNSDFVRSVCEDMYGNYWIGTIEGVNVYEPQTRRMIDATRAYGIARSSVQMILRDRQNSMWICSRGGVELFNRNREIYTSHEALFPEGGANVISGLAEWNGELFVSYVEGGLVLYRPSDGSIREYRPRGGLSSSYIEALYLNGNVLWAGTRFGGLNRIDLAGGGVKVLLPGQQVYRIAAWKDFLVVGTGSSNGQFIIDRNTLEVRPLVTSGRIRGVFATDIGVDGSGNCWIAVSEGLVRHNLETGEEKEYFFEDKGVLGTSRIQVSFTDSKGRLWFGTTGSGLLLYHPDTDSFTSYTTRNSLLANDYINAIAESRQGYLLIADNDGLARMNPETGVFYNYSCGSSFPSIAFSTRGLYVISSGEVFVSGYKKLVSFQEGRLPVNDGPDRLYFSSIEVDNVRLRAGDGGKVLSKALLFEDGITLKGSGKVLSVRTSAPDFLNDDYLEYRLEGFSREWIRTAVGENIVYTGLKPRKYLLCARICDPVSGEVRASDTLGIRVRPEWYMSGLAKVFYLALLLGIVLLAINYREGRMRFHAAIVEENRERERIREANDSKMQFFTHISHELRTPVTLMRSQVDSILAKGDVPPFIYNKVQGLDRNLGKISSLLEELRDFRKQESGAPQLSKSVQEIHPLLERISLVFKEYASQQGIDFRFRDRIPAGTRLSFDAVQMDKVLYNLMSNALKNTPSGGSVTLEASREDDNIRIAVSDTGCGIPAKYLDTIFQPFFQVPGNPSGEKGTGLGLSITKGIVEAHGGKVSCSSVEKAGSVFTVLLPMGEAENPAVSDAVPGEEPFVEAGYSGKDAPAEGLRGHDIRPSILIVEDNDELRSYLTELFSPVYTVSEARDGEQAWEMLEKDVPDIILSDLMMPGMDGNSLCRKVKNNFYTSHVPFVILTAKVAEESVLESLRYNADDYITKPFNPRILVSKCNNLVQSRLDLQQKYARSGGASTEMLATNEIDRDFIDKATRIVRENISDQDFDVARFASEMALGRTVLYDKIKGVTGQTPNRFISTERLKYARELLSDKSAGHSVSEVSWMAGFSSPSYFIKSFKALYGITPSAWKESL